MVIKLSGVPVGAVFYSIRLIYLACLNAKTNIQHSSYNSECSTYEI